MTRKVGISRDDYRTTDAPLAFWWFCVTVSIFAGVVVARLLGWLP